EMPHPKQYHSSYLAESLMGHMEMPHPKQYQCSTLAESHMGHMEMPYPKQYQCSTLAESLMGHMVEKTKDCSKVGGQCRWRCKKREIPYHYAKCMARLGKCCIYMHKKKA
ncbi:hypothetical protein MTO96_051598, partial [Rhipicephalus appendiculatus]